MKNNYPSFLNRKAISLFFESITGNSKNLHTQSKAETVKMGTQKSFSLFVCNAQADVVCSKGNFLFFRTNY
ncbi:MAG: hypothetical protein C4549_00605 [Deltaproteobacteria bacterium]|nr:MAG: hypothetical protein C4549_00605 [Deltaproteobacteria bacterium]